MCTIGHLRILGVAASVAYTTTLKPQWIALQGTRTASSIGASYRCVLITLVAGGVTGGRMGERSSGKAGSGFASGAVHPAAVIRILRNATSGCRISVFIMARRLLILSFRSARSSRCSRANEFLIPYAGAFEYRSSQVRVPVVWYVLTTIVTALRRRSRRSNVEVYGLPNGW